MAVAWIRAPALASPAITKDDSNDRAYLDAVDSSWATFTGTARYAVVYDKNACHEHTCVNVGERLNALRQYTAEYGFVPPGSSRPREEWKGQPLQWK